MSGFIGSAKNKSPSLISSKLNLLKFSSVSIANFIKLLSTFSQNLLSLLVLYNFHLLEYILPISFELGYVICYVIVKSLKHQAFQGYTPLTDESFYRYRDQIRKPLSWETGKSPLSHINGVIILLSN